SFGGAGGQHVCALADALGLREALVPIHAGVLSALGMLVAPPGRTLTRSWTGPVAASGDREVDAALALLAEGAIEELEAEGLGRRDLDVESSLDLRYRGQSYTLNLPWRGLDATTESFHERHALVYGHRLGVPVELVQLRVRVRAPARHLTLPHASPNGTGSPVPTRELTAYGLTEPVPVYAREALAGTGEISGPAVLTDAVATVWLAPGWWARADPVGNLWLRRGIARDDTGGHTSLTV
ncbi:MAG: hydantoinase/oxoprolinase family protein, partial [Chromatiaceae bacterium]